MINDAKLLVEDKIYYFFDIELSAKKNELTKNIKPSKIIYDGNFDICHTFIKLLKSGEKGKIKIHFYRDTLNNHQGRKIYDNYNECCEDFDKKCDEIMGIIYQRQIEAKQLYDSIEKKKINLRERKLKRLT